MDPKTASTRMQSLVVVYDMDTTFFSKVIDGISDVDAHNRLGTKANHVAWLAGSLVYERYEMARLLGVDKAQDSDELFKGHKGIQDGATYPSLADLKKDWENISPDLRNAFVNITDEKLDSPFEMPGMKMRIFDMVAFTSYRESNCIGQIVLWRRLLGYEAMKYD